MSEEDVRLALRHKQAAEIERLRAEIERLRALHLSDQATMDVLHNNAIKDKTEIERLRAALALSQSQNYCTLCGRDLDLAAALERKDKIG